MARRRTYRSIIRELALDNYGFVTTTAAEDAGVPAGELPKLAARGGLDHVAYGLYRIPDVLPTRFDEFVEAILRVGDGAHLHGESVLAVLELADVNPRRIHVATPRRARPTLPPSIVLTRARADAPTTVYEGLRMQRVADAILDCRGRVETERLRIAAERARARGFVTGSEWKRLTRDLQS